jgi:acyl carrier protein
MIFVDKLRKMLRFCTHPALEVIMAEQTPAQLAVAELLIEALNLEDIQAADIDPEAPLFGEGLGLDSIDALEIALAISQKYGVQMQAEDESTRNAFATLASLTDFISQHSAP